MGFFFFFLRRNKPTALDTTSENDFFFFSLLIYFMIFLGKITAALSSLFGIINMLRDIHEFFISSS